MIQTEKLKRTGMLLSAILPALFFASCSTDDLADTNPGGTDNNSEIRFEIGFAPQTRTATDAAFNTTWENGDEIGLYAVSRASGVTGSLLASNNYIHNVKLIYSSADGGTWTPETNLYFDGGNVLDFYAYYPYNEAAINPTAITFNVQTDQSGKSNYNLSDLLTAKADNTGNGYGKGETVTLTFSHALSLIQVEVPPASFKGMGPSEGLTVKLRGVKAGSTLNLGSGVTVPAANNDALNITMHRVEQSNAANYETSYTYRALVPAQNIAQGASLFWFINAGVQLIRSNALDAELTMTAGKAELYEIPLPQAIQTVKIPAGTFQMGSPGDKTGGNYTPDVNGAYDYEKPQHGVTLTKDFYMGKYQVTNAQYAAFLNAKGVQGESLEHLYLYDMTGGKCTWNDNGNLDQHLVYEGQSGYQWGVKWDNDEWVSQAGCSDYPVIWVTWYGALEYARWVGGRLPTEAEWEYACRAETTSSWSTATGTDSDLKDYAWYSGNNPSGTKAVGEKLPNTWGIYDMHGNVWEWCSDWYDYNYYSDLSAGIDPTGPDSGGDRVLRGGGWFNGAQDCRSASRGSVDPGNAFRDGGFRVVFVP